MIRLWPLLITALCGCAAAPRYSPILPPAPTLWPIAQVPTGGAGEPLEAFQHRTATQFAPVVVPGKANYVDVPFPQVAGAENYNWFVESSPYLDGRGWFHNANVGYTHINGRVWAVTTNHGRHLWYRLKGVPK